MTGPGEPVETVEPVEPVEPVRMLAANVVLWRRHGEGGQGQRPGTKMFKGGSKVYVHDLVSGWEGCQVIGRPRHGRGYRSAYLAIRHLHSFRPVLVRSPAVLRIAEGSVFADKEDAEDYAVLMEYRAWDLRSGASRGRPHPEPCHCHECLTLRPHR
ncbi:hypothetical protein OG898_01775 [Streptomyces sp. NBC_00193]|uniref:hypothetical protein n=1 Tax=Streptomyces sp. NBC_00193 TaxID=2975675 RepID=UPI002259AC7A|nr:hypothetical protein [Streptomyces sp. NBC_00193]MCX5295223.1 hypothetical protein [Streptomyces sp. NBC_00193]